MLRNKDEHIWLDPHFVPEGRSETSPAIHRWGLRGHRSPSPGGTNEQRWIVTFPSHEWLGKVHVLLTEHLQNQVLCFDSDCVTSEVPSVAEQ